MSEPAITAEDEARYMRVMADYDAAMRDFFTGPVPICHFTPMMFHSDDSDSGGDGYECEHCGHTEDSVDAWAKVEARR